MDMINLASRIVEKGVDNVDLSMLPWDKKMALLTDVAIILRKKGNFDEAVKALVMSGNVVKLRSWTEDFITMNKVKHATMCAIPIRDQANLEKLGMKCMNGGYYRLAAEAFKKLGKEDLADFVKMNFLF